MAGDSTERYVALLRGVNVGGRTVRMERLRALFGELGLAGVRTYIQSGNVFFDTDEPDRSALTTRIEGMLGAALGYPVPVFLRTVGEFEAVLASDPFAGRKVTADMRLAIMFTKKPFRADVPLPMTSPKGDVEVVHATPGEVFVIWYIIGGRPPDPERFLAPYLSGPTTTRFFHTAQKILAAARK
jgi:uncharacterized protein (DUF1697 family)